MRQLFHQQGEHAWYSQADVVENLHRQQYRVYAIGYVEQGYTVEAYDPQGLRVQLRVSPQTSQIITWIIWTPNEPPALARRISPLSTC